MKSPEKAHQKEREQMVKEQLIARGIKNPNILTAFLNIPRHSFVPLAFEDQAYEDHPIQIGCEQTISQPYIAAYMLEQLELKKMDKVLEIGTGSGYQTALLAELVKEVYSLEIICDLQRRAQNLLNFFGYSNVYFSCRDGQNGWPECSPFDKIVVAAATDHIPEPLIEQLKENGMIIIPLGDQHQDLVLGRKVKGGLATKQLMSVRFVPLTKQDH